MAIDTTFDFRSDANGKDPDWASPTLRDFHRRLWSRPPPDGRLFELCTSMRGVYLHHQSDGMEFFLSSDAVVATFLRWPERLQPVVQQFSPEENEYLMHITYTMGGMMVFPGNQIDRKWTINQARGCNRSISDRFDLTVECIRRHYLGEWSPLQDTLGRYRDFFGLFGNFAGYLSFFLLDDIVDARDRLRRYLEQRRELGESEFVLDGLPVEDVLRMVGARAGTAARPSDGNACGPARIPPRP